MADESSDLRGLLTVAAERPRRRGLPDWARSVLLGLASGGVQLALMAATGPLGPSGGEASTRARFILLLTALPALVVMGWMTVRGWRRGARGVGTLLRHVLAIALVAAALPLSGHWLSGATSDFFLLMAGLVTPGLSVALAAGFAFGAVSHDAEGWPNAEEAGRGAGMGCLGCAMFMLAAYVVLGIIEVIQAQTPAPAPPGTRFDFRAFVPTAVFLLLLLIGGLSFLTAPIAGLLGGYLRGEPPTG